MPTVIAREIVAAYLETEYRVDGEMPCTLKIGERSAPLSALHRHFGVQCSAFVTAWNPYSEAATAARNTERQRELLTVLVSRGYVTVPGVGQHPRNGWPGEQSYLVPGLSREDACAMGNTFGQNAIVWAGEDAVPQLLLLR